MASLCRVCLSGDLRLRSVQNELVCVYDKLANSEFVCEDPRPRAVCSYCHQKLLKCYTFSKMAQRSEQIFSQLFTNGVIEVTQQSIAELDFKIKKQWSIAPLQCFTIGNINEMNQSSNLLVKEEPISVKEELVDVESVSNYTLKEEDINKALLGEEETNQINESQELGSVNDQGANSNVDLVSENFVSEENLIEHVEHNRIESAYFSIRNETCKKPAACSETLSYESNVLRCMTSLTGDMLIPSECDNTYSEKSSLNKHLKTHTGEKAIACSVCNKAFSSNTHLRKHLKNHSGEKPYSCSMCVKSFSLKCNLIQHQRTHTGGKPFFCSNCDKTFKAKSSLIVHRRTQHSTLYTQHEKIYTFKEFKPDLCYQ